MSPVTAGISDIRAEELRIEEHWTLDMKRVNAQESEKSCEFTQTWSGNNPMELQATATVLYSYSRVSGPSPSQLAVCRLLLRI